MSTAWTGWLEWLASAELTAPSGDGLSWWNPEHPGYAYPEISGLLLQLLALERAAVERRRRLAGALVQAPDPQTGVARGGRSYTFDTAMALRGLLAQLRSNGEPDLRAAEIARTWAELLVECAERSSPAARGSWAGELRPDTHWSHAFGAHQAKVCGALVDARAAFGDLAGVDDALSAYAAAATHAQADDGRFRTHRLSPVTYVHSHCYAIEGLIMQAAAGHSSYAPTDAVLAGAKWLVTAQQPNGGFRAWHDGRTASGELRADATAQALRIWTLVDPDRYAAHRHRAAQALLELAVPERGLRYEPASRDISSWSTIFGYQAMSWHRDPARADASRVV
jgi:hypothetical protein